MSDLIGKGIASIVEGGRQRDVVVYELSPVELRQILLNSAAWPGASATPEELARYQIDVTLMGDISLTDLAVFARLPVAELEAILPSQLDKIRSKARELNPFFFAALERMAPRQSNA